MNAPAPGFGAPSPREFLDSGIPQILDAWILQFPGFRASFVSQLLYSWLPGFLDFWMTICLGYLLPAPLDFSFLDPSRPRSLTSSIRRILDYRIG